MNAEKKNRVGEICAALGKSLCYLGLFLGMQVAVMVPVVITAMVQSALDGSEGEVYDLLSANSTLYVMISGLITIGVVLAFYLLRRKKLSEALWLRPAPAPALWAGVALTPALYLTISIVLVLLPEAWTASYQEASDGIASGTLVGVIATVAVAPVVEEFIFRGLMMTRMSRVMPGWLAAALAAAMFGLCHGHPVWFGYTFVIGMVYGWIDLRAGSIWPSILGHMVFNAIGQLITFLPEEGAVVSAVIGALLIAAIVLPILDRKGIAGLFRRAPKAEPVQAEFAGPGVYEFDPWEE